MPLVNRRRVWAGAALVSILAACSSGGTSSSTTSASSASSSSSAAGSTTTASAAPTTTVASSGTTTVASGSASTLPAPDGDAFYTPPDPLPAGQPGDIIWSRPFAGPGGSQGYQVLYLSETATGAPVAVSGVVVVPGANAPAAPAGGRPVLAWAHGTTGMGDSCAPSKQYPSGQATEIAIAGVATGQGYIYTATDYEGLGPPGDHPYVVGQSEGRNVLDSARAGIRLAGSGGAATSPVVVWGHSQGVAPPPSPPSCSRPTPPSSTWWAPSPVPPPPNWTRPPASPRAVRTSASR